MSKRILLIDDDKDLTEGMVDLLENEGYTVEVAWDGFQGEDLIRNNTYDIILLDFKMPGLTGVQMLKRVKDNVAQAKVLFISGKPLIEKEIMNEGVFSLVKGFVHKPFNIDLLLKKISDL
jgi:DNA-binding response OmpR family regulator